MKVIASHNGMKAVERAWQLLTEQHAPLDACVAGVTLVEDDPDELTVGYGGLPNADGVVELDAAVMDGRTHRAAGVAGLQGVRHPTRVARLLMEQTTRCLLVGEGAQQFALANGFSLENLLTDKARRMWLHWKRMRFKDDDWLAPPDGELDGESLQWFEKHFYQSRPVDGAGTVHCAAQDASGNLACVTSTSGHAFKIPGRVGDSPIIGAGLYADNAVGTCGSVGYGEANLENLSSFAAVEVMRSGMSPQEAGLEVLRRITDRCHAHQRAADGRPRFNLQLYLLAKDGTHAGVALHGPKQIAVADARGVRLEPCVALVPS